MSARNTSIVFLLLLSLLGGIWVHVIAEDDPRGVADPNGGEQPDYSRGFYGVVGLLAISLFYVSVEKIITTLRSQKR